MGGYQAAAAFRRCEIEGAGREGCFSYGGWHLAGRTSPALRATSPFQGEAERGGRGWIPGGRRLSAAGIGRGRGLGGVCSTEGGSWRKGPLRRCAPPPLSKGRLRGAGCWNGGNTKAAGLPLSREARRWEIGIQEGQIYPPAGFSRGGQCSKGGMQERGWAYFYGPIIIILGRIVNRDPNHSAILL